MILWWFVVGALRDIPTIRRGAKADPPPQMSHTRFCRSIFRLRAPLRARHFTVLPPRRHDGVYKELSALGVQKPWLRALADRKAGITPTPAPTPAGGLAPKRMSDSFHRLVRDLPPRWRCANRHACRSSRCRKTSGSSTAMSMRADSCGSARCSRTSTPSRASSGISTRGRGRRPSLPPSTGSTSSRRSRSSAI